MALALHKEGAVELSPDFSGSDICGGDGSSIVEVYWKPGRYDENHESAGSSISGHLVLWARVVRTRLVVAVGF